MSKSYVGDKDCKEAFSAYNEYGDNYTYLDDLCNACREGIWGISMNVFEFDRVCLERSSYKKKIPYEAFKKKVCYRDEITAVRLMIADQHLIH